MVCSGRCGIHCAAMCRLVQVLTLDEPQPCQLDRMTQYLNASYDFTADHADWPPRAAAAAQICSHVDRSSYDAEHMRQHPPSEHIRSSSDAAANSYSMHGTMLTGSPRPADPTRAASMPPSFRQRAAASHQLVAASSFLERIVMSRRTSPLCAS